MRRAPAVLIVLLIAAALLAGTSMAETPTPQATTSSLPLPFSGGTNSISGTVTDGKGNGVTNAKVTLYYTAWIGNDYKAKDPVRLEGVTNPQYTTDGSQSIPGLYVFTNIPSGVYVITAEKGGVSVSKNIMVTGGMTTENLIIQQYIEESPTPTPPPAPTPQPSAARPTSPPATAVTSGTFAVLFEALRVLLVGLVGIQLVVSVVIIALQVGRKH